ncbi:MAG: signal recognition particle-docking protein FtsY [Fibrobacteres bacterium]|nr:signal recognition particle-docking protein FtsY [Fibrobacterota bacterium]
MGLLSGLTKTRQSFFSKLKDIVTFRKPIKAETLDELEAVCLSADMGVDLTVELMDRIKERVKSQRLKETDGIVSALKEEMESLLPASEPEKVFSSDNKPVVLLVIGVNGAGKTTTIGKLGAKFKNEGKKVIFAACDTFRAAAIEQLQVWADRNNIDMVLQKQGADSAAVAFDAYASAKSKDMDMVLVDTAGRLHTKVNLMAELKKIKSVLQKRDEKVVVKTILVLDGTSGQNALVQAREFNEVAKIDGVIITKLDGTAKGGVVFSVCRLLNVPVLFVGTGEKLEDLEIFDKKRFIQAFFEENA